MYSQVWILSIGFYCSIIGSILIEHAQGRNIREVKEKNSMLIRDDRISSANGGYNDNYQYSNGYDYSAGNSGPLGSRDSSYDNYGISHSSRNYDGYGNARKSGDFRYFGNSNSNMHRDFDTSLYSTRNARNFKNRNEINAFKKFQ